MSPRQRLAAVAVTAALTTVSAMAAVSAQAAVNPATDAGGCNVTYRLVGQWPHNFQAAVAIRNLSGAAWKSWQVAFDFADGQRLIRAWGARAVQVGATVTATNLSWNGRVPPGGRVEFAFIGGYGSTNTAPTSFTVNGHRCGTPPTTGPTTPPTTGPTTPPTAGPTTPPPGRVDNPYAGAVGYADPDWTARVTAQAATDQGGLGPRMTAISRQPTAVWLDSIAAITAGRGLRGHLDAALDQQAAAGRPVVVTLVLYNLPNRNCLLRAPSGELTVGNGGLAAYRSRFIDPIAAVLAEPAYADLRVAVAIEPMSLTAHLATPTFNPSCQEALQSQVYRQGIGYALTKLDPLPNVYNHLDIGYAHYQGYDTGMRPYAQLLALIARDTPGGLSSVDGFTSNVAQYVPIEEPFIPPGTMVGGQQVRSGTFYDWNPYFDELHYVQAMHTLLVAEGFAGRTGVVIDTSRNGWGGPGRPTGPASTSDINAWVSQTAVDKRPQRTWWCNQIGSGLGALPQADPVPHVHAYAWIMPPGVSDGWWTPTGSPDQPVDGRCQADSRWPVSPDVSYPTNALPGAPPAGRWFPELFAQLVRNAYPSIPQ